MAALAMKKMEKMRIWRSQTATDEDTDARVYAEVVVATTVNISRAMILLAKNIPFFTNPPHVAAAFYVEALTSQP